MGNQRLLVSWIGHADLMAMAADCDPAQRQSILRALGARAIPTTHGGPIRTLLEHESFSHVHLLSNYPPKLGHLYAEWLGSEATVHEACLADPTDYSQIFRAVDAVLSSVTRVGEAMWGR